MMITKEKTIKRYFVILTIIIIPAFILWGSQVLRVSFRPVLKVFEKNFSKSEFLKFYNLTYLSLKMRLGDDFYKLSTSDIKNETIKRIILLTEAKRRGLKVTDKEVARFIINNFKKNQKFDKEFYLNLVKRYFRTTPSKFEEMLRQNLLIEKLFNQVTKDVKVSDSELLEVYRSLKEKAKINFIKINSSDFYKKIHLDSGELKSYFNEHKEEFRTPLRVKIKYVFIPFKDEKTLSTVKKLKTLKRIKDFFGVPILESNYFSLEEPISNIGWQRIININAFNLEMNETSKPIVTERGIYVIKLIDKKPPYLPKFEEVKEKIKELLTRKKALRLAKFKAFKIYKKLKKNEKIKNLKIEESDFFKRGDYIPNLGKDENFTERVFNAPLQRWQPPYKLDSQFIIFKVVAKEGFSKDKFEKEKEEWKEIYLKIKKLKTFNEFFFSLLQRVKISKNL